MLPQKEPLLELLEAESVGRGGHLAVDQGNGGGDARVVGQAGRAGGLGTCAVDLGCRGAVGLRSISLGWEGPTRVEGRGRPVGFS